MLPGLTGQTGRVLLLIRRLQVESCHGRKYAGQRLETLVVVTLPDRLVIPSVSTEAMIAKSGRATGHNHGTQIVGGTMHSLRRHSHFQSN